MHRSSQEDARLGHVSHNHVTWSNYRIIPIAAFLALRTITKNEYNLPRAISWTTEERSFYIGAEPVVPSDPNTLKHLAGTTRQDSLNTCLYASTVTASKMPSIPIHSGLLGPWDPVTSWHMKLRYISVDSRFVATTSASPIGALAVIQ